MEDNRYVINTYADDELWMLTSEEFKLCPASAWGRYEGMDFKAMQVSEDPDLNIQGVGPTIGAAFAEAALAKP